MSDNDDPNYLQGDEYDFFESKPTRSSSFQEEFEAILRANRPKQRVFTSTQSESKERLRELFHVQHWADISSRLSEIGDDLKSLNQTAQKSAPLWNRARKKRASLKTTLANLYSAFISILTNGWEFEHLVVLSIALTAAISYSLAPAPSEPHLASILDFHYLATSLVYLVSFGAEQTLIRRDTALRSIVAIKSTMCQMVLAFLLWNRDRKRPSEDFEDRVITIFQHGAYSVFKLLSFPTWNRTRHFTTKAGMEFRHSMRRRLEQERRGLTEFHFDVHALLEEVKESDSIQTHETTRISEWDRCLHIQMEQIQLVKEYRTTNIARSFVRVFILICPPMWGVYFSYVAGNIANSSGQTDLAFALCLCFVSILLIIILVNVERALEDPGTTSYAGDRIEVFEELKDVCERFNIIAEFCRAQKEFNADVSLDEEDDGQEDVVEEEEEDAPGVETAHNDPIDI